MDVPQNHGGREEGRRTALPIESYKLMNVPKNPSILLYAEGFKAERTLQHYRTIQALPIILGSERRDDANYLDTCRSKRNIVEYDHIGAVTEHDANELIEFTKELKSTVYAWLKQHHPELGF